MVLSLSLSHTHSHTHVLRRTRLHQAVAPLAHCLVRASSICGCVRSRVCRAQHPSLLRLYYHSNTHASGCQSGGNPCQPLRTARVFFLTIFGLCTIRCTLTHALGMYVLHTLRRLRPGQTDFCVRATVLPSFGYRRSWCFRSNTGFTALGICPGGSDDGEGGQSPRSQIESCLTPSSLSTHLLPPCTSSLATFCEPCTLPLQILRS
jgi:hypothetical protein